MAESGVEEAPETALTERSTREVLVDRWPDFVREQALEAYKDSASVRGAQLALKAAEMVDEKGRPPDERTIYRWIRKEIESTRVDIRKNAVNERRSRLQEGAWNKAEDVLDKLDTATDGKDLYGMAGAFKTLYDVGAKAAGEGDGDVIEEYFAMFRGSRRRSHAGLEYVDGEFKELGPG